MKKILLLVLIMVEIFVIHASADFTHPNMYINSDEINSIKTKVALGQEPWKTAYNNMITEANELLSTPIQSVVFNARVPPSGDRHDYWTDLPYTSDGVYNPNADREDYNAAITLGKSVRSLGLAYAFTGDSKYADKAMRLINAWTIDPSTKMNPKFTNDQSQIELAVTIPGMFYGADLIWNYPGWTASDKTAFKSWVSELVNKAKSRNWCHETYCQNHENWRLVLIASGSTIFDDLGSLQYASNRWKELIPMQMDSQGKMTHELSRTRSFFYSLYAINSMIQVAEIARHYNIDLYNYKTDNGRGLELALDFHAPYAAGKKTWPYQEIRWDLVEYSVYELAYSFKQKTDYEDVIIKRGRPMYEQRIMGPVTLTHTHRLDIIGIPNPTPTPIPSPTPIIPGPTPGPTPPGEESNIVIRCYKKSRQ